MGLVERINQVKAELSKIENWDARYELIIKRGKVLPALSEDKKIESNLVKGCQSQVWLTAELDPQGFILFQADSDAMIVKGLVALLVEIYSASTPDEILLNPPNFLKELGFDQNLSPNRANGLYSMIKQMQYYATAFKYLQAQGKK